MNQIKCVLKVGDQFISPKLEFTKNVDDALVIVGKRKAKKARDMIVKLTNGLVNPKLTIV
jgi:hypothetical protein